MQNSFSNSDLKCKTFWCIFLNSNPICILDKFLYSYGFIFPTLKLINGVDIYYKTYCNTFTVFHLKCSIFIHIKMILTKKYFGIRSYFRRASTNKYHPIFPLPIHNFTIFGTDTNRFGGAFFDLLVHYGNIHEL